jgi:hypothetical protein
MAAKLLKAMGYPDVRNMGGLRDWAESGRAVEPA